MIKLEISAATAEEYEQMLRAVAWKLNVFPVPAHAVESTIHEAVAIPKSASGWPEKTETPAAADATAVVQHAEPPKTVPPEENPGRRRRTKAEMEAARAAALAGGPPLERPTGPKPAISSGEERVNPQDEADVAGETTKSDKLTHTDVRVAIKSYANAFGPAAAAQDLKALIGVPIPEIPDTQEALGAAIGKITGAIASGARPGHAPEQPKQSEPAAELETGDLFGDEPPAQPAPRATKADCTAAAIEYAKTFDPSASPPQSSAIMLADMPLIISATFGPAVKNSKDVAALPGDETVNYGLLHAALQAAILENPFKR